MCPINKALKFAQELKPAIITDSPTGKGRIKMLKQQLADAKKSRKQLTKEINSYDYITDQQVVDNLADRIAQLESIQNIKKQLKQEKDNYRSKNFLGIGDGSGNAIPSQLYRYWSRHFGYQKNQDPVISNRGTDIIDLSKNTIRVTPETQQSTALFNEFVEKDKPSVRKAKEYQQNRVNTFGDNYDIPTKNISLYAGIEDGKFKTDSLKNFNPNTIIFPARNVKRNTPKITQLNIIDGQGKIDNNGLFALLRSKLPEDRYMTTSLTLAYPESNPHLANAFKDHAQYLLETDSSLSRREKSQLKKISNNKGVNYPYNLEKYFRSVTSTEIPFGKVKTVDGSQIDKHLQETRSDSKYTFTDSEGKEHPITDYDAAILDNKMVFGNPNGGVFIGRVQDISREQLDSLNSYLKKNPSWLVRPDLGSFDQYRLDSPTADEYLQQYFENPDADDPNVYIVGTTKPNKLW